MTSATIEINYNDGTKKEIKHLNHKLEREFGKKDQASFYTTRSEVNNLSKPLKEKIDEIYVLVDGISRWGGLLQDINKEKGVVELVVDSHEAYMEDAPPTDGANRYQNVDDSRIVKDAIQGVPGVFPGTIDTVDSNVSFVFSHASRAYKARAVEEATSGELIYNADSTIDYVDELGSDRTGTTISPSNQNIAENFKAKTVGGSEKVTHLRMVGAGEGKHQITAEVVASSYSSGDREKWRTYSNKSITDEDTLENQAETLINELNTENVEVKATIKGIEINLGDSYHVEYPEKDIDRDMRVVSYSWIVDNQGERYRATFSTRQKSRTNPESKRRNDIERYNKAVEGVAVPINAGGGRQPVDSTHDYKMKLYYPSEVKYEHRLNVRVMGLGYRAYSSGAASGGDHTHSVTVNHPSHSHDVTHPSHSHRVTHPSHSHSLSATSDQNTDPDNVAWNNNNQTVTTTDNWQEVDNLLFNVDTGIVFVYVSILNHEQSQRVVTARLTDGDGRHYPSLYGSTVRISGTGGENSIILLYPKNANNSGRIDLEMRTTYTADLVLDVNWSATGTHNHFISDTTSVELGTTETSSNELGSTESSQAALGTTTSETSDASGGHTHSIQPGIIDQSEYPSNCDVLVNGTSMGTSFGAGVGPFNGDVDITGQLNEGQVNTIEVTSDSLGHIQAYVEGDVYRQILGNG